MINPELILRQLMMEGYEGENLLAAFGRWIRALGAADVAVVSTPKAVARTIPQAAPITAVAASAAVLEAVAPPENAKAIARKAIAQSMLSPSTIALASHLIERFNLVSWRCDPGSGSLADDLGISVRTVRRSVASLLKAGLFGKAKHGGRAYANAYQPNWPVLVARAAEGDVTAKGTTLAAKADKAVTQNHLTKPDSESLVVRPQRRCAAQREPDRRQMAMMMPIAGGREVSEQAVRQKLNRALDDHMRQLFMPHNRAGFIDGMAASTEIGGAWDKAISAEMDKAGSGLLVLLQAIDARPKRRAVG